MNVHFSEEIRSGLTRVEAAINALGILAVHTAATEPKVPEEPIISKKRVSQRQKAAENKKKK